MPDCLSWHLQQARAHGEHLPKHCRTPYLLQYEEVGKIGKHVERLFQIAGRENCHVVLFDDFFDDTQLYGWRGTIPVILPGVFS